MKKISENNEEKCGNCEVYARKKVMKHIRVIACKINLSEIIYPFLVFSSIFDVFIFI